MAHDYKQNNSQKEGKPKIKIDTRMLHYIVIGMVVLNMIIILILYGAIITPSKPPIPLDQQVKALVQQNEQLYNMKQNIKRVVK